MQYFKEVKTRVTWLLIGLALSLGIAEIIKGFEATLQQNLVLASFIPLVVYISDAVGTQMEAIIIRSLHTKGKFNFAKFFWQQAIIVSMVAIIIGIVAAGMVAILNDSTVLGVVVGVALFFGTLSSLITGSVLPYVFWRMHSDPAEASGPVATVIQDFISVVIFFVIAQLLLQ